MGSLPYYRNNECNNPNLNHKYQVDPSSIFVFRSYVSPLERKQFHICSYTFVVFAAWLCFSLIFGLNFSESISFLNKAKAQKGSNNPIPGEVNL